jgi:hypothetical protein
VADGGYAGACGTLLERFLMFGLDPAPRYRLSRPPLVQAFGQVKFSARAKLATMEGVAPIQDLLDPVFPYMSPQQVQQVSLLLGPAVSPATFDEHQGDTITEHRFVNVLSPSCSSW